MSGTDIILGELQVLGNIHGGMLNTLMFYYATPADWAFKQFTSQQELDQFALDNSLAIVRKEPHDGSNQGS